MSNGPVPPFELGAPKRQSRSDVDALALSDGEDKATYARPARAGDDGQQRARRKPQVQRRTIHAFSAGGIVLRGQRLECEVLLVGREQSGLWALPKGTP